MFPGESIFSRYEFVEQQEAFVDGRQPNDVAPCEPPVFAVVAQAAESAGQPEAFVDGQQPNDVAPGEPPVPAVDAQAAESAG